MCIIYFCKNSDFIEVLPRGHYKRSSANDVDGTRYQAVDLSVPGCCALQHVMLPSGNSVHSALN
jgi:hypothetical protein